MFREGLIGRGENPPPQFEQTFRRTVSTQTRQKVHSKLQIMASIDSGGRARLQCSQVGLNSSMPTSLLAPMLVRWGPSRKDKSTRSLRVVFE
jgi:hypothetical protein